MRSDREEDFREEIRPKKMNIGKTFLQIVIYLVCIMLGSYLLVTFVVQRTVVDGESMTDTLQDGDNILVDKLSYRFGKVDRFDIIVFEVPFEKGVYYIKRVIGLPGETLQILEDGTILINGEPLKESYGKETIRHPYRAAEPVVMGENEYFVMGDNRNDSTDSRSERVGNVTRAQIVGKAWLRIFPLRSFGVLRHQ